MERRERKGRRELRLLKQEHLSVTTLQTRSHMKVMSLSQLSIEFMNKTWTLKMYYVVLIEKVINIVHRPVSWPFTYSETRVLKWSSNRIIVNGRRHHERAINPIRTQKDSNPTLCSRQTIPITTLSLV